MKNNMNNNEIKIMLVENVNPMPNNTSVFNSVIGQTKAIKKIKFFLETHSNQTPLPTLIFTGSQGLGKTMMAQKVAEAMNRKLIEINCGTIEKSSEFIEQILVNKILGNGPVTIFFDEAHKLSTEIITLLLTLLNPNFTNQNELPYGNIKFIYDMKNINVIFATTDSYKIFRPLLNRCVEIYFDLYTNDELFEILKNYSAPIQLTCDKDDIAFACRGRARDAFLLSHNIKRYCYSKQLNILDQSAWKNLKEIFDMYPMGLNEKEIKYLFILKEYSPISSSNIASKLGLNTDNIEADIELRPRELGLINNNVKGRFLTEKGIEYLKTIK